MNTIDGIVKDGRIELIEPIVWPEGTQVRIRPLAVGMEALDGVVFPESEQADDQESVSKWIEAFEAIPPLEMTPEEEADWQAARAAQRDIEARQQVSRHDRLRSGLS